MNRASLVFKGSHRSHKLISWILALEFHVPSIMTVSENESPSKDDDKEQPLATTKEDEDKSSNEGTARVKGVTSKEIVRLNVGGTRFEVSRETLVQYEGSMLASLISGKWKEGEGENEIFIDRDGRLFGFILAYLRSGQAYVTDLSDQLALKDELDYFGIDADMSQIHLRDDFVSMDRLTKGIKKLEKSIEEKKKKRAAMKESYRIANEFSERLETQGLYLQHDWEGD